MSKPKKVLTLATLETLPPAVPRDRFSLVNEYHNLAGLSMAQSCAYMVLAGVELLAQKKACKHGEWEKLFQTADGKNDSAVVFGMNLRTAQRYMGLAQGAKKSITELQALCGSDLPLSQMPLEDRERIVKAVRKVADGQTYQQLALDFDIAKKPHGSGARGGNKGKGKGDGDEETLEGDTPEEQAAIAIWKPIVTDLELEGMQEDSWAKLPDKWKKRLKGVLTDLNKRVK